MAPSSRSTLEYVIKLVGAQAANTQLGRLAQGFDKTARAEGRITGRGIAKFAAAGVGLYGVSRAIRASTTETMNLARGTLALQRISKMDAATASTWIEMAKVRGITTDQLGVSMGKLTRTVRQANNGSDSAIKTFKDLGVNMAAVQAGDLDAILRQSADGMTKLTRESDRGALAQELFGRSGRKLLPLLAGGSAAINEQAMMIEKYGARIASTEDAKRFIESQREAQYALDGLKIMVGTQVVPVLVQLFKALLDIARPFQPLLRNTTALTVAAGLLAAAFVGIKIAGAAATLMELGLTGATLKNTIAVIANRVAYAALTAGMWLMSAAQWALNVAMSANPIALIIIGIVALAAAFVLAYNKVGWFRNIVDTVFGFIKRNWPIILAVMTGGLGVAVLLIVKNFGKIKSAATAAVNWVKTAFTNVVAFIRSVPGKIGRAASGMFNGIKNAFRGAINFILSGWNSLEFTINLPSVLPGPDSVTIGTPNVPLLAQGGTITAGGSAVVGEAGPELVTLPRGAEVVPLGRGAMDRPIVTQVYLDGRKIADAVGSVTGNQLARA